MQDSPAGRSAALETSGVGRVPGRGHGQPLPTATGCAWSPDRRIAAVWAVLGTTLPRLPRDPVVRSTGALLALGVDCASHSAAKGAIPEVTTAAARSGSSRLLKNVRLLRDPLN
ncbi:hypothetical protein [Streptomyces ortus]|uniref:Uncharacterized protein n=1 Tax=Streptomyces ortus TaxID=2867268 RepID=A0ABT3UWC5_9ACTN|nr:hypothetical protein [Streptomyces ortus]MCX4231866.1 hypothetical protein [Streptomyces ortus]